MFSILVLLNACGLYEKKTNATRGRMRHPRPRLEALEDRLAPAPIPVTTTNATGPGSLDQAITTVDNSTVANNTITFAGNVSGTITLPDTETIYTKNNVQNFQVTITGPGSDSLTISGPTDGGGVITINEPDNPTITVTISNLTISNGSATSGGGIHNNSTLYLTNDVISNNSATSGGGGIYNGGTLTLSGTSVTNNTSGTSGGGIENDGTVSITNSTIEGNTAVSFGGGIYNTETLSLVSSSVTSNTAAWGGGIYNSDNFTMNGGSIEFNTSTNDGGGFYSTGSANLTNVDIEYNSASGQGGGFAGYSGSVSLTSCILNNNSDSFGSNGGVWRGGWCTYQASGGQIIDPVVQV